MPKKIIALILIFIFVSIPTEVTAKTYTSEDNVYNLIKKNLLSHNKEFTIEMDTDTMDEIGRDTDLIDIATALDDKDTSKDSDYLKLSMSNWSTEWSWSYYRGKATLTLSVVYRSTLKQEKTLDTKIDSVLKALDLDDATDYEKVKAIHDYIIKRVSYDQTYKKHTAYNALINKSSVCEGYALAAYRMFTDAGIESRIITGTANGGSHAWNIVKVDGKWYNIDLTWDDPIMNTGEQVLRYDYFLKNTKEFEDHTRASEFNTKSFRKAYPIAENSYKSK
jgi:transglutaminase/protease-like cytokinesis protein 3